tara:strand:- start:228 stop:608 length:381 start_codon:yes stop_codon:yes gene_type:complete
MVTYTKETLELLDEVYDKEDAEAFIKVYGEKNFYHYYEEYVQLIDDYSEEAVTAYLELQDISCLSSFSEAYMGQWESGADFAQNIAEDCGDIGRNMASWIEIDWQASWENLQYDYDYEDGHVFRNY